MLNTKLKIKNWLEKYEVKNYIINEDLTVDVDTLYIVAKNLTDIEVQFNVVKGNCNISNNRLTSLKGCPKKIEGSFFCNHNQLHSLQYAPENIKGDFYCEWNPIEDLNNFTSHFNGIFHYNGPIIESVENLFQIQKINGYNSLELNLNYEQLQKVFLYYQLDKENPNKTNNVKRNKI